MEGGNATIGFEGKVRGTGGRDETLPLTSFEARVGGGERDLEAGGLEGDLRGEGGLGGR